MQHGRPEQRVEVADVLADEMVQLGGGAGLPVRVEIQAALRAPAPRSCRCSRSARRTRRRNTCPAHPGSRSRNRAHRARCPSPCRPVSNHSSSLARTAGCRPWPRQPVAQVLLEVAQLEEQVLRIAQHRLRAGDGGDGVLQVGRRIGGAAVLAAVAVLVRRAAARAGAAHEAVGQEHAGLLVVGLAHAAARDGAALLQRLVQLAGIAPVLLAVRGVEVIEARSAKPA